MLQVTQTELAFPFPAYCLFLYVFICFFCLHACLRVCFTLFVHLFVYLLASLITAGICLAKKEKGKKERKKEDKRNILGLKQFQHKTRMSVLTQLPVGLCKSTLDGLWCWEQAKTAHVSRQFFLQTIQAMIF